MDESEKNRIGEFGRERRWFSCLLLLFRVKENGL